ncbi:hypothetical protein EI164_00855 [Psychrobacter sp. FME13]|uniref:hypothetical protein n=1 Tax=Psychrobacter sp. FME13 TaxID=2487708 RepID=UPI00178858E9|nr:hypothetical protein [Psychrobacter sp. FME13]MBE0440628.1 hypothetical protein [Psychrobacter sp. FME13]
MRTDLVQGLIASKNDVGRVKVGTATNSQYMQSLQLLYGKLRVHEALLQCMYVVKIEDIFGNGPNIPWFRDKTLCYLATEADMSLGSAESESFYAGAYQASYLTQKSSDDMDMTFIETLNADISNSYRACHKLAFNDDGTMNESKKYAFKLSVGLINHKKPNSEPVINRSWLVGAKSARPEISSTGRSEIVKVPVTFQKLRPLMFER